MDSDLSGNKPKASESYHSALLYPAAEIAERLGVTERVVVRFARKHAIPLIRAFNETGVRQLEAAAAATNSVSLPEKTQLDEPDVLPHDSESFGTWESAGRRGRLDGPELDSARELVRKKFSRTKGEILRNPPLS